VKRKARGRFGKKLLELVACCRGEIKFKLLDNHWVEIVSDKRNTSSSVVRKFPALPVMPHVDGEVPTTTLEA